MQHRDIAGVRRALDFQRQKFAIPLNGRRHDRRGRKSHHFGKPIGCKIRNARKRRASFLGKSVMP